MSESLLGLGAIIREFLDSPKNVDELWGMYNQNKDRYGYFHTFDNFILAIDLLFMLGCVRLDHKGNLRHATP